MKLTYVRCRCCLATSTVEAYSANMFCGVCHDAEPLEVMGVVTPYGWQKMVDRCKCDHRCTFATGPKCECSCGGENHGAGMLGFVEVVAETGKVSVTANKNKEKHAKNGAEFRALCAEVDRVLNAVQGMTAFKKGTWIPRGQWEECSYLRKEFRHARDLRSHSGRVKNLKALLEMCNP